MGFKCCVCKEEYELTALGSYSSYINRPSNKRYQFMSCIYCDAETEDGRREIAIRNKKWNDLSDKYPRIFNQFAGRNVTGEEIYVPARVAGGVGDGWFDTIAETCEAIQQELDKLPADAICHFSQMKEKFGTLRWYSSAPNDEILDLIDKAERATATICEDCGKPGVLRVGGWALTLCDEDAEKRGYTEKWEEEESDE